MQFFSLSCLGLAAKGKHSKTILQSVLKYCEPAVDQSLPSQCYFSVSITLVFNSLQFKNKPEMSLVVTKASIKMRQVCMSLRWCLQTGWEISVMGGHSPHSSEALQIQPLGEEEQRGLELFECLGWKCELKLILLFTKLLSEVLSCCFPSL